MGNSTGQTELGDARLGSPSASLGYPLLLLSGAGLKGSTDTLLGGRKMQPRMWEAEVEVPKLPGVQSPLENCMESGMKG